MASVLRRSITEPLSARLASIPAANLHFGRRPPDDSLARLAKQRTLKLHKAHPSDQLGLKFALPADSSIGGLVVVEVVRGGMASRAGVQKSDIVHCINGRALLTLADAEEVSSALAQLGKIDVELRVSHTEALTLEEHRARQDALQERQVEHEEMQLALALSESETVMAREPCAEEGAEAEAREARALDTALKLSSAEALSQLQRRQSLGPGAESPHEVEAQLEEANAELLARALSASTKPPPGPLPVDAAAEAAQLASALALSSADALEKMQQRAWAQEGLERSASEFERETERAIELSAAEIDWSRIAALQLSNRTELSPSPSPSSSTLLAASRREGDADINWKELAEISSRASSLQSASHVPSLPCLPCTPAVSSALDTVAQSPPSSLDEAQQGTALFLDEAAAALMGSRRLEMTEML